MSDLDPFCQPDVHLTMTSADRNRVTGSLFVLLLLGLGLLASARPASADDPTFADRLKFGSGRDPIKAVALGDMIGDGLLDLVVANDGAQSLVYLNDGAGNYYDGALSDCASAPRTVVRCFGGPEDHTISVAVADMNLDGKLDIVAGLQNGQSRIYLKDGRGDFTISQPFGPADGTTLSLALGDVNGDAAPDIVAGDETRGVIYLNNGKGVFYSGSVGDCAASPAAFGCFGANRTAAVALADVNGDGTLDIVAGSNLNADEGTQNAVYLNNGAGIFATAKSSDCALPENAQVLRCFGANDPSALIGRIAAGDVDGDPRASADIVVAYRGGKNAVYLNSGEGVFSTENSFDALAAPAGSLALDEETVLATANNPAAAARAERSLTLADVNADGAADVVAGTSLQGAYVYLNDRAGQFSPVRATPFGTGNEAIAAVAAGDVDSDGDLDLVVGNDNQRSAIYRNNGAGAFAPGSNFGSSKARPAAVAVGDLNDDGRLDVVYAENNAGPKIYLNSGEGQLDEGHLLPLSKRNPVSVAVADLNGDRKLDLVVGYKDEQIAVYLNDGQANFSGKPSHFGLPNVWALATGDLDGNGSLDIVAGYNNGSSSWGQNTVYLNDGQGNFGWQGGDRKLGRPGRNTRSVAVGDLNDDGALDVVVGNYGYRGLNGRTTGEPNYVYLNDGAGNFDGTSSEWELPGDDDNTTSVALGDVNGDGNLDILVGNYGDDGKQDFVHFNDGSGHFQLSRNLGAAKGTTGLALADMNGDGALDVIAVHPGAQHAVHINDGTGTFPAARDFGAGWPSDPVVAVGDMDGDGLPDIVSGGSGWLNNVNMVTLNRSRRASSQTDGIKLATLARPDGSPDANYFASPTILLDQRVPITYTLYGPADAPFGHIELDYSTDGGGLWLPAVATTDTVKISLAATPFPTATLTNTHVYTWDRFASGFFDQSDNVVLRLKAYPGTGVARNGVPDAHQWPYANAATSPVRVRGTRIKVLHETQAVSNTVSGAYVFRLPADQVAGGRLLANQQHEAYRTNERGYLQGTSKVMPGDRLVALWPVTSTHGSTLYYTSAPTTDLGLAAHEVTGPGTQELIVSKANPLLLFDLDVSLEWDARNDSTFLADLTEAIKRSSETFYQVSGGQMALGRVTVFQNKENWLNSDVVIYANSSVRPRATLGGVVNRPTSDVITATKVITDAFLPGQIRMGPAWDPYGENRAELTRDWQRALTHEFGHYFLYLPDNYLGYDKTGVIKTVDCRGSFMTNTSDDDYSKFLTGVEWRKPANRCGDTIAARLTGRSDWETITKFYPMLHPAGDQPGPAVLPLDVTEVSVIPPVARPTALPARYFDLRDAASGQRVNVAQGQGYLYQTQNTADLHDDRVIPLGSTSRADRLRVRGASPGDRVCVYDDRHNPPRWDCEDPVSATSSTLKLKEVAGWAPNIIIEPRALAAGSEVVTRTVVNTTQVVTETLPLFQPALAITVTLPQTAPDGQLNIQVLPAYEPGGRETPMKASWAAATALDATNPVTYTQVIPLESRIASGFVRVWIHDTVRNRVVRESISRFYIDQNWGQKSLAGLWGDSRGGLGGDSRGGLGGDSRGGLGSHSLAGLAGDSRGGLGGDSRGGLGGDSRGGLGGDSRGGLGGDSRGGLAVIPAAAWAVTPAAAWAAIPAAAWAVTPAAGWAAILAAAWR